MVIVTVPKIIRGNKENLFNLTPKEEVSIAYRRLKSAIFIATEHNNESAHIIQLTQSKVGGWFLYYLVKLGVMPATWYLKNRSYVILWKILERKNLKPYIGLDTLPSTIPSIYYAAPAIYCKVPKK